jgi:hypothetical protein
MRDHRLPPAEIFSSPNALHELFVQALAAAGQAPAAGEANGRG